MRARQPWNCDSRSSPSTGGVSRMLGGAAGGGTRGRAGADRTGCGLGAGGPDSRRASSEMGSAVVARGQSPFASLARGTKKRFKTESNQWLTAINHVAIDKNSDRAEARPEPAEPLRGFGGHSPAQREPAAATSVPSRRADFREEGPGAPRNRMLYIGDNARHPLRPYPRTRRR